MTVSVSAVFDDRESASLALMRLRRHGIELTDVGLTPADAHRPGGLDMALPYNMTALGTIAPAEVFASVQEAAERRRGERGRARLSVTVPGEQRMRAEEIIRAARGRVSSTLL